MSTTVRSAYPRGGRSRGGALRSADRLDLDLRQRGPEARLAAVARLRAALADADLVAADMTDDLGRHLHTGREIAVAVAAGEEHVGLERLAFVRCEPVDEQPLPLADAILLAAD